MSECNRCTLAHMQARARERGVEVVVEVVAEPCDPLRGWISARYSDEEKPSAWFMALPARCEC